MRVYRINVDINRYCGFRNRVFAATDPVTDAMRNSDAVFPIWEPPVVSIIPGNRGDFASAPTTPFAPLALSKKAVEVLAPLLEGTAELLPFTYGKERWWVLYLPHPVDCLDVDKTIYQLDDKDPNEIRKAAFVAERLPRQHIFRVVGGYDNFVTGEFKRLVDENRLTGLQFELMWRDELGEDVDQKAVAEEPHNHAVPARKPGRRSKRDRLLERLWEEVINRRGDVEWLRDELEAIEETHADRAPLLDGAGAVLNDAIRLGISRDAILTMTRSLAYHIVFDTLVAIEEEGADKGPALRCLHEDLLMANPAGYEE